jgi:hypothetical protein
MCVQFVNNQINPFLCHKHTTQRKKSEMLPMVFWFDSAARPVAMLLPEDDLKAAKSFRFSQHASKENKANYKPI